MNPVVSLFVLALPVASIAWTVTHEEVLREAREWCQSRSQSCRRVWQRKFFYLFTCEYCFSHYVTALIVAVTGYQLLFDDWRGYVIGGFSIVWIANVYMTIFARLRLEVRHERVEIARDEQRVEPVARRHPMPRSLH